MDFYGYKDTDLIPELSEWQRLNGENFSIAEWMQCNVTTQHCIALASLFSPSFAEYQGGIFYENAIAQVKDNLARRGESQQSILQLQRIYNHEHLIDLFADKETVTKQHLECVGKILVDLWTTILQAKFPHLDVRCELTGLDSDDLSDMIVTFWAESKNTMESI